RSLGCKNIVTAIVNNTFPVFLVDRLIPRKVHLLVRDTQFDLELLQPLLLGAEVVNIGVADVVSFTKGCITIVVDDLLRQLVESLVVVPKVSCVQNMVVVTTVVESDQLQLEETFDLLGRW